MHPVVALALVGIVALAHLSSAAPVAEESEMQRKLNDLQDWAKGAPEKRMVAWQPMKRSEVDRETLFRAIETRLLEVLAAGERLGISPEEVLEHLRIRNAERA